MLKKAKTLITIMLFIITKTTLSVTKYKEIALKTCKGWCLKKFPEVKTFIEKDLPKYNKNHVFVDYLGQGEPRFVVRNENDEDVRVLDISKQNRSIIRLILKKLGFLPIEKLDVLKNEESSSDENEVEEGCLKGGVKDFVDGEL